MDMRWDVADWIAGGQVMSGGLRAMRQGEETMYKLEALSAVFEANLSGKQNNFKHQR